MNTMTRTMVATIGLLTLGACINWGKSELFASVLFTGLGILIAISLHEVGHVVGGVIAKSKLMFYAAGLIAV